MQNITLTIDGVEHPAEITSMEIHANVDEPLTTAVEGRFRDTEHTFSMEMQGVNERFINSAFGDTRERRINNWRDYLNGEE